MGEISHVFNFQFRLDINRVMGHFQKSSCLLVYGCAFVMLLYCVELSNSNV